MHQIRRTSGILLAILTWAVGMEWVRGITGCDAVSSACLPNLRVWEAVAVFCTLALILLSTLARTRRRRRRATAIFATMVMTDLTRCARAAREAGVLIADARARAGTGQADSFRTKQLSDLTQDADLESVLDQLAECPEIDDKLALGVAESARLARSLRDWGGHVGYLLEVDPVSIEDLLVDGQQLASGLEASLKLTVDACRRARRSVGGGDWTGEISEDASRA